MCVWSKFHCNKRLELSHIKGSPSHTVATELCTYKNLLPNTAVINLENVKVRTETCRMNCRAKERLGYFPYYKGSTICLRVLGLKSLKAKLKSLKPDFSLRLWVERNISGDVVHAWSKFHHQHSSHKHPYCARMKGSVQ